MDIFSLPGLSWLPSLLLTLVMLVIGGWYISKNAKSKAEMTVKEAQKNALDAMQIELTALRGRVEDVGKENVHLRRVIETIITALGKRGIIITISGEMIDIEVQDKKSTTIRIHEGESS